MILFLKGKTMRVVAINVPDEKIMETNCAEDAAFVCGRL
jgi:hypothetical protein